MTHTEQSRSLLVLLLLSLAAAQPVLGDENEAAERTRLEALVREAFIEARAARQAAQLVDALAPPAQAPNPEPTPPGTTPTKPTSPATPATPGGPGGSTTPADPPKPAAPPVDPLLIRCQMADGTVIVGKLSAGAIEVDTKFGRLSVPILQLVSIRPGIDSRPQQRQQIQDWLTQLAGDDANQRKAAAAELAKIGPSLRPILEEAAKNAAGQLKTELPLLWNRIADEVS